eukprot:gene243-344_t
MGGVSKLELFYSPTPNGWKISILLAEAGIPYELVSVRIDTGEQFSGWFQEISPNGRIPAVRVTYADGGSETIFESGAIMLRLGEIFPEQVGQRFCGGPSGSSGRSGVMQAALRKQVYEWLFWMNANLGPVAGQVSHFTYYAPKVTAADGRADYDHSYALDRYKREYSRLVGVLEAQLSATPSSGPFILGGAYTVVDMAVWCW